MRKILKKIYLSSFAPLISLILTVLSKFHKPFMVYGYFDWRRKLFFKHTRISSSAVIMNKKGISFSDHVWIWHFTIVDGTGGLEIGKGCQIGANVGIFTHSSHISIRLLEEDYINLELKDRTGYIIAPVVIGDYTFIGAGAIILPGVKIGKKCIISAGSVVGKDVKDYDIVAGTPAKKIGDSRDIDKRFKLENS